MLTSFSQSLLDLEKKCLVQLAAAAQDTGQAQMALNAVIRAQQLDTSQSFTVSQEFAKVLWLQGERKLATEYLKSEMQRHGYIRANGSVANETLQNALNLALLVRLLSACFPYFYC